MKISLWSVYVILIIAFSAVDLLIFQGALTAGVVASTLLRWCLVIGVGVSGVIAFIGHFFRADEVAGKIGWPAGSPFQREIAFANLGYGVAGLLCLGFGQQFRLATIAMVSVFLLGAGLGHIHETKKTGNVAEYNTGAVVLYDLLMPVVLIVLWVASATLPP